MFNLLDRLRPTATGLDQLPARNLRSAARVFYRPSARLFNLSISTGTSARTVEAKVFAPSKHADFRPISIKPVLTRLMERTIVRRFLYPAFLSPLSTLCIRSYAGCMYPYCRPRETVSGFNSRYRTFISVYNQPATQDQLSLPSLRGW